MKIFCLTDKGRERKHNEDSVYCSIKKAVIAVADGVGGHSAGERASRIAVDQLAKEFKFEPKILSDKYLYGLIKCINDRIFSVALENFKYDGMGSTLVFAVLRKSRVFITNIGDSRAYILRDGKLSQVTIDHSHVQELILKGEITNEEAKRHPMKNVITKCLGARSAEKPDVFEFNTQPEDLLLLCSDGLSNMLNDEEISHILKHNLNLKKAAKLLVKKANEKGGKDNISVALMRIEEKDAADQP